jgi:hypothetical protein
MTYARFWVLLLAILVGIGLTAGAGGGEDNKLQKLKVLLEARDVAADELAAKEQELRAFQLKHAELKELPARQETIRRLETKLAVFNDQSAFVASCLDALKSATDAKKSGDELAQLINASRAGQSPAEALLADLKASEARLDKAHDAALLRAIRQKIASLAADLQDAARPNAAALKAVTTDSTSARLRELKMKRELLLEDHGPGHPKVRALEFEIELLQKYSDAPPNGDPARAAALAELRKSREVLLQDLGEGHPKVRELDIQINYLMKEGSTVKLVPKSDKSGVSEEFVASYRKGLQEDLDTLQAKQKLWAQKLAAEQQAVKAMAALGDQESELRRQVEIRRLLLDAIRTKIADFRLN